MNHVRDFIYGVLFILILALAIYGKDSLGKTCDQRMYDRLYFTIAREAIMESKVLGEKLALRNRYDSVMNLRTLCHGQLSTYEKENPMNYLLQRGVYEGHKKVQKP